MTTILELESHKLAFYTDCLLCFTGGRGPIQDIYFCSGGLQTRLTCTLCFQIMSVSLLFHNPVSACHIYIHSQVIFQINTAYVRTVLTLQLYVSFFKDIKIKRLKENQMKSVLKELGLYIVIMPNPFYDRTHTWWYTFNCKSLHSLLYDTYTVYKHFDSHRFQTFASFDSGWCYCISVVLRQRYNLLSSAFSATRGMIQRYLNANKYFHFQHSHFFICIKIWMS